MCGGGRRKLSRRVETYVNIKNEEKTVLINSNGVLLLHRSPCYEFMALSDLFPLILNLLLRMNKGRRLNYAAFMQKYILPGFMLTIVKYFYFTLSLSFFPLKAFFIILHQKGF
jgi:hypothetical protein